MYARIRRSSSASLCFSAALRSIMVALPAITPRRRAAPAALLSSTSKASLALTAAIASLILICSCGMPLRCQLTPMQMCHVAVSTRFPTMACRGDQGCGV